MGSSCDYKQLERRDLVILSLQCKKITVQFSSIKSKDGIKLNRVPGNGKPCIVVMLISLIELTPNYCLLWFSFNACISSRHFSGMKPCEF